jgi:hypothetical protein
MPSRRVLVPCLALALASGLGAAQPASKGGAASIDAGSLREWLGYLASDQLQGRQIYTEGLGLAAAYIADHLRGWGVKPGGDAGSYFQTVKVVGVKTTSRASVTVEVNGRSRTFKDGEGVAFAKNMGGRQTISADRLEFVGYGLQIPSAEADDYAGLEPRGKVIVWLGAEGPGAIGPGSRRLLAARSRLAIEKGALAVFAPVGASAAARGRSREAAAARGSQADSRDFTTAQRYDRPVPPTVTAHDEFFEFLFSGSEVKYSALQAAAARREPIAPFTLENVKVTLDVDADYSVVSTKLTRNVVGIVEGSDPRLKDTFVLFGAHYDHIGYSEAGSGTERGAGAITASGCSGQTRDTPRAGDVINNGADDDGSGTVAVMAAARAFALGPRPKRSVLFVWHSGEESGLYGSRYMADHPVVPLDRIAAHLNIDMIGRNRCDRASEANTVYLVGSDRISTELHDVSERTNRALAAPLKLDYELNDPADPESIYTRSDHYSYASRGIPIIFYTTGLHRDYHYVTDEIDRIEFGKMTRIAQLVYETGFNVANLDHFPARDNKGPRAGARPAY